MGSYHVIGALLLLSVASLRSQELHETTDSEESTQPLETLTLNSTDSPSVKQLEVANLASSADPGTTLVRVAKAEVLTSQEPRTMASNVASTADTKENFEDQDESLTTVLTTGLSDQSTTFKTVDLPTIPSRGEVDGSESPAVDYDATGPPTANNETDGGDDEEHGTPTVPDTENNTEDDDFIEATSTTKRRDQETSKGGKGTKKEMSEAEEKYWKKRIILIGVIVSILVFILGLMVFLMLRKKKRSGSFRTNSKKNAKKDVWAGQVPELGDGKAAQEVVENGTAGNGPAATNEEEMITFVSGEKMDSMVEMKELGSGEKPEANGGEKLAKEATVEEKTPLLEEASEESPKPDDTEELFPAPPVEQELMANGV